MKAPVLTVMLAFIISIPGLASDMEKKGYVIANNGDTISGTVLIRKELNTVSPLQFFSQVRFVDSAGAKKTYKPGDLKGYGLALVNDTIITHFVSFDNVEMQGMFGSKKERVFLLREVGGYIQVYYLRHSISTGYSSSEIPEIYLLTATEPRSLIRIKPKALKVPTRYRRSDILPHLPNWPETEYSKINDELSFMEVMVCVATYNEWKKANPAQ
jgi:hypothetical protein